MEDESEATWWFDDEDQKKVHVEHYVPIPIVKDIAKEMVGAE